MIIYVKNIMLTLQWIAKEIDALERQGMPRPAAERKFWDVYQRAKQYTDNDTPSFGLMLDSILHPKATDGMVGKVGCVDELRIKRILAARKAGKTPNWD